VLVLSDSEDEGLREPRAECGTACGTVMDTATHDPTTATACTTDALSGIGPEVGAPGVAAPELLSGRYRRQDATGAEAGEPCTRSGLFDVAAAWPMSQGHADLGDSLVVPRSIGLQHIAAAQGGDVTTEGRITLDDFGGPSPQTRADMSQATASPAVDSSSHVATSTGDVVTVDDVCRVPAGAAENPDRPQQPSTVPTVRRR